MFLWIVFTTDELDYDVNGKHSDWLTVQIIKSMSILFGLICRIDNSLCVRKRKLVGTETRKANEVDEETWPSLGKST